MSLVAVPEVVQLRPHLGQPSCSPVRDVLDDDETRAELADDPGEFVPEPAAFPSQPPPSSRNGNIRARKTPADDVNGSEVCFSDGPDIFESLRIRPPLRKHAPTEPIDLDLPHDTTNARALEPTLKSADAGEERTDGHGTRDGRLHCVVIHPATEARRP